MRKIILVSFVTAFVTGATAQAQPANPLSASAKRTYDIIKNYITKSAAKMPEENYAFKPTPDVRSFGQIVGHIADANYGFCSAVAGEKPPAGGFGPDAVSVEKTKTAKADLEKVARGIVRVLRQGARGDDGHRRRGDDQVLHRRDGEAVDPRVQHAP